MVLLTWCEAVKARRVHGPWHPAAGPLWPPGLWVGVEGQMLELAALWSPPGIRA